MSDRTLDPVPQRLAAAKNHPWYHPYWSTRVEVRLAGIRVGAVIAADAVEGWADLVLQPARIVGDSLATARFRGEVQILPRPAAGEVQS